MKCTSNVTLLQDQCMNVVFQQKIPDPEAIEESDEISVLVQDNNTHEEVLSHDYTLGNLDSNLFEDQPSQGTPSDKSISTQPLDTIPAEYQ